MTNEVAIQLLEEFANDAPRLGALLGPEGALGGELAAAGARALAEAFRVKGVDLAFEHIRMPPQTIGDFTKPT